MSMVTTLAASPVFAGIFEVFAHPDDGGSWLWWTIGRIILVVFVAHVLLIGSAVMVLAERRVSAMIQRRHGPNRVGPQGVLQPIADLLKFIFKEDQLPAHVNKVMYLLAPAITLIPAMVTVAVIPYTGQVTDGVYRSFQVADINIGVLYILAIASLGVYGITLGGWSSNSKYSLLGGVRSSAQMISYELSMGLAVVPVVLLVSSLRLGDIVAWQGGNGWLMFHQPVAFFIFLVASYAETNRLPFDLPEAETELVAGYHTEYSAMKFALFFLAEYVNMMIAACLVTTLFCGGWTLFGLEKMGWLMGLAIFIGKVSFFLFAFIWVRWTLPRFRYDQLMKLGWAWFLPVALANVIVAAGAIALGAPWWVSALVMLALIVVLGLAGAAVSSGAKRVPRLDERKAAAATKESS